MKNVATGTFGTWDETGRRHPPRPAGRRARERRLRPQPRPLHLRRRSDFPTTASLETIAPRPARPIRSRPPGRNCCKPCSRTAFPSGRDDGAHIRGRTLRSWRRLFGTRSRSPSIPASATTSSRRTRCSAARRLAGRRRRISGLFGRAVERAGWGRGAVGRLGDHGAAGLREEPQLRQQPAPGRPGGRSFATTRSMSWTSRTAATGIGRGRATQGQPGLLPAVLQELLPHGRHDALPPVR